MVAFLKKNGNKKAPIGRFFKLSFILNYYTSSLTIVFFTVTESEFPPPRANKIIISNKTTPPTTHTQGCAYQVDSVVDVVVTEEEEELLPESWAKAFTEESRSTINADIFSA